MDMLKLLVRQEPADKHQTRGHPAEWQDSRMLRSVKLDKAEETRICSVSLRRVGSDRQAHALSQRQWQMASRA